MVDPAVGVYLNIRHTLMYANGAKKQEKDVAGKPASNQEDS